MRTLGSIRGLPCALGAALLLFSTALPTVAQNASVFIVDPHGAAPAARTSEGRVVGDILRDQRDIWSSPFRLRGRSAVWLLPVAAIAAGLLATDRRVNGEVTESDGAVTPSNRISNIGSGFALAGAAGAFYAAGRAFHNDRAKETGLLGVEALVDETIVVTALKQLTNRERPNKLNGRQDFFDGGKAFPSGHAAASWALATVVAEQYADKPLVRWSAIGAAAAVSVARVTARAHSPSDVFVGGLIGYLIGRHVAHRSTSIGGTSFEIEPLVDPSSKAVGATGTFSF